MWDVERGASFLLERRHVAGYSLRELSQRSGVSHQVLSMLERGVQESPRMEYVDAIGRTLGFTLNDFARVCAGETPVTPTIQATSWPVLEQLMLSLDKQRQEMLSSFLLKTAKTFLDTLR